MIISEQKLRKRIRSILSELLGAKKKYSQLQRALGGSGTDGYGYGYGDDYGYYDDYYDDYGYYASTDADDGDDGDGDGDGDGE